MWADLRKWPRRFQASSVGNLVSVQLRSPRRAGLSFHELAMLRAFGGLSPYRTRKWTSYSARRGMLALNTSMATRAAAKNEGRGSNNATKMSSNPNPEWGFPRQLKPRCVQSHLIPVLIRLYLNVGISLPQYVPSTWCLTTGQGRYRLILAVAMFLAWFGPKDSLLRRGFAENACGTALREAIKSLAEERMR
jgi:hypothetical protein